MSKFWNSRDGYALVLALIFMPLFLGFSLLVVDLGRGNNAHSDLQAAADALALAGARELDGGSDSIARAKTAMANLTNSVSFLALSGAGANIDLTYADAAGNEFNVIFLSDIPNDDDTPIDQTWVNNNQPASPADAAYVYVAAQSQNLATFFPIPVSFADGDVPIQATAVATYSRSACDVTPVFICNPFEGEANPDVQANFETGKYYARHIKMEIKAGGSPGPGNFGFLRVGGGNGAQDLGEALATGNSGFCYQEKGLDTEPGAKIGQAIPGVNVRFGLYGNSFKRFDNDKNFRPSANTRKGAKVPPNACDKYNSADNDYDAMAFPPGKGTATVLPGGLISPDGDWDLDLYWDINHRLPQMNPHPLEVALAAGNDYDPPAAPVADIISNSSSYPGGSGTPPGVTPSRYDVYRYELNAGLTGDTAPNGETGVLDNACYSGYDLADYATEIDRRTIFSAIVNCIEHSDLIQGAATDIPAEAFASMFVVSPAIDPGAGTDPNITLELIDITGRAGNGTLSEFLREEAFLVR